MKADFVPVPWEYNPFSFSQTLRRDDVTAECRIALLAAVGSETPSIRTRLRRALREKVEQVLGEGERTGLLLSMGFGFRDVISAKTEWSYKATGLAHLLVVSGYQVTMVFGAAYVVLRYLYLPLSPLLRTVNLLSLTSWSAFIVTACFLALVGFESSTLRAGLVLMLYLLAWQSERHGGMLNGILASATLISLLWPGALFEPGVQLTYAALSGIMLGRNGRRLSSFISVSFFATVATSFIVILWFGTVAPIGVILNPWLAPLLGFISCNGGFAAVILHCIGFDSAGIALRLVAALLQIGTEVIVWCSGLPGASSEPTGLTLWSYAASLGGLLAWRGINKLNQWVVESGID